MLGTAAEEDEDTSAISSFDLGRDFHDGRRPCRDFHDGRRPCKLKIMNNLKLEFIDMGKSLRAIIIKCYCNALPGILFND